MLSDGDIHRSLINGTIKINPKPTHGTIQPASVDLNLADVGLKWCVMAMPYSEVRPDGFYIDPSLDMRPYMNKVRIPTFVKEPKRGNNSELFVLPAHTFMLSYVQQHIWVPNHMTAFLHGRSSLARFGLFIHVTAGLLDAGWDGCATLELFNASSYPIRLWQGMSIATVTFHPMTTPAAIPYGHPLRKSKYQGDESVQVSRYHHEVVAQQIASVKHAADN